MTIKKIKTYYSKPSSNIEIESVNIRHNASESYKEQKRVSKFLDSFSLRKTCVCCGSKMDGVKFTHRDISFIECVVCGHIQTLNKIPINYPENFSSNSGFSKIYKKLSKKEYLSRENRIYKPKFDWIIDAIRESLHYSEKEMLGKSWVEIGSGAGYFLSAASKGGVSNIKGFERNDSLCDISNEINSKSETILWKGKFEEVLDSTQADIYCSFFVLEHIDNLPSVWRKIKEKPIGTLLIFSVPVFGLSCLLEESFDAQYARNLDGVVHTHIFTDSSIQYGLKSSGCDLLSEWVFGQDFSDFLRLIGNNECGFNETKIHVDLFEKINSLHDEFQHILDCNRLSDQRHILAVRV